MPDINDVIKKPTALFHLCQYSGSDLWQAKAASSTASWAERLIFQSPWNTPEELMAATRTSLCACWCS